MIDQQASSSLRLSSWLGDQLSTQATDYVPQTDRGLHQPSTALRPVAKRIALITPPLDSSGGIGRLMSYVLSTLSDAEIEITQLDPRGHSPYPLLSVFPLARAWAMLVLLGLTRRIDLAHINISSHGSSIRKPFLFWTCRLFRIPAVIHLHASEYQKFFASLPRWARAILARTFASADAVIVLGEHYRCFVCRELRVPPCKVEVILNGSPGPFTVPRTKPRGTDPLRLLFLGRLGLRKGVPEALAALADSRLRAEPWLASFAGDGDVEHYERRATELGLRDRVTFYGWVDPTRATELLSESHLLLLPSRAEGLPMAVIEAFAHGVPAVSTPVGAIPDVLEDGVNGLLIPAGDASALADALLTLIHDEPLRLQLAQNARRLWEERLGIGPYTRALVSCWDGIVDASPGDPAHA
jgi:glycosyltransferase involved in cell wall biosynthesis